MTTPPMRQLGKYQLTDVLGQGAMGVVYRAFDPVLNRYLAIKVMSTLIASDSQLRDRFLREAQAAGSLQHPNVVTVYDFGEADEHLFIAMEYVEGVDLAEVISRRDALAVPVKLDIMIDALNGLAYAHSHGLVHRDIKPANIRIGEDHRAKLMDFGIARIEKSSMTQTGALLGTPQYMAPEQVTGGAITAAADIFAAGAVLYEFLTYAKAFSGDSLHVILYKIVSEEPVPLRKLGPDLPASIEAIVSKAMAKNPAQRYQSALEMATELARARDEITGTAQRSTVTLRASSRTIEFQKRRGAGARRRNITVASIALLIAALALWRFLPLTTAAGGSPSVGLSATPQAASQQPSQSVPSTSPVVAKPDPAPAAGSSAQPRSATPAVRQPGAGTLELTQDSMVRAVRTNVVGNRRLAEDAGAVVAELAPGDSLLRVADGLMARGRVADAVQQLSIASVRWIEAERNARERHSREQVMRGAERAASAAPSVSLPVAPPPSPAVEKAATAAATPAPAATDPRPEIEGVVQAYARAIESGNMGEIRRAFPAITPAQQQAWEKFFPTVRNLRNLKVLVAVEQLQVSGSSADARVSVVLAFEDRGAQTKRESILWQAALNRDGGTWRLTSIR